MRSDDRTIEELFRSLKNYDRDMLTIEEFKQEIRKVQGRFSEDLTGKYYWRRPGTNL